MKLPTALHSIPACCSPLLPFEPPNADTMKDALISQLYDREINDLAVRSKRYRKLYSDRRLIDDLDIVNELEGHSGCVNALSWSKSGKLLASGSDDQHLNIHEYQPEDASSQFKFTTTVATGHTQNIFSVKFMPWSNDRTVITCAGDGEVRIFDLEYAGAPQAASRASNMATSGRRSRRNNVYDGVRYLSDGDTNCRVYRSHGDRVKRIVTESSPHLFLTCSEDGEVRQWDLRQPSTAYPAPRGGRLMSSSPSDDSLPPPLISYKRYQLDLNTISCSPSQPHYIALGGAHLHAFLHDRRMTGRDKLKEMGKTLSPSNSMSSEEEELMNEATQCVRKFAPKGQKKMRRTDNGHITALKISDARPNEMIASWSGNHIYSFDLRGGESDADTLAPLSSGGARARASSERKRKRRANGSEASLSAAARAQSKPRTRESNGNASLRIRYQNGQTEDVPIRSEASSEPLLTAKERDAHHLAKATVRIRTPLFGSESGFNDTLGRAMSVLSQMDDIIRDWRFPMDPTPEMVVMQQTLRANRESARRFVQAAGTLARALGGKPRTIFGSSPIHPSFMEIEERRNDIPPPQPEHFGYDFIKAILLWLESGVGRLIEEFTRPAEMSETAKAAKRLPIPASEASTEAIDEFLIPYLLQLASDKPIIDLQTNRFETDERRHLFSSEKTAVLAFAAAVKMPFEDLSSAVVVAGSGEHIHAQDRSTAKSYWGLRVARGLLLNAAESVNFSFVSRAFGGSGRVIKELAEQELAMEDELMISDSEREDETVENVEMLDATGRSVDGANADDVAAALQERRERERSSTALTEDAEMTGTDATESSFTLGELGEGDGVNDEPADENDDENDEIAAESSDEDDVDDDEEDDDDGDSDTASEEDGVPNTGVPRFMLSSAYERRQQRDKVGLGVPCTSATRSFRGHCNVKTVKDVNYFGPDDDFVVSGSDDGNLFIWDARTSELVNILEGDGEVVNVVQGHPYETMLAVSGIDHTVKIFSPDHRARTAARLGQGVNAQDPTTFSSLSWPSRIGRRSVGRRRGTNDAATTSEPAVPRTDSRDEDEEDESFVAPNGLASRRRMKDSYAIMNQNDVERQGGNSDAFLTVRDLHPLLLLLGGGGAGMW